MKNSVLAVGLLLGMTAFGAVEPWNQEARQKFAGQRFGIFIHWGLYSNYAQGEWYLRSGDKDNGWKPLDREAYERMMYGFCPSKFDATEWARTFREAGARYVTITSRHHDGFSLWPTKVDDGYNVAKTPFGRDILGELKSACDQQGLQLNFYYSLMDWHRADYPAGDVAKSVLGDQKGDYASYKKFMLGQIGELIDRYHPGNIWFDGEWEHARHQEDGSWRRTLDWEFDDIYDFIHSKHVLVANNNHQPIREKEDIQLFERDLPGDNSDAGFSKHQPVANDRPVEQCDVIQNGVWGYRIGETNFRTAPEVVAMVARAASKDANLLMNIGPDGSGQLPARAVRVLKEIGPWFARNGQSIYETRGCPIGSGKDIVATRAGDVLYLHFLRPGVDSISFKTEMDFACGMQLADGRFATLEKTADGQLKVTARRPDGYAFDLVVKLVPSVKNPFPRKAIELSAPASTNVARFCAFVKDRLATDGFDTLVFRVGYRYAFESHPDCRAANALTKSDAQAILSACRAAKIKLVPKMNLFGHQTGKGGKAQCGLLKAFPDMDEGRGREKIAHDYCRSICPKHPQAMAFATDLAAELASAFESDVVHIGCDEVFEIGLCERCRNTPTAALFSDWVNGLASGLKAKGVRTMIWGDRLVDWRLTGGSDFWESADNGTEGAIRTLDRGIEICDWRYWPRDGYPSVDLFAENGFKMWISPWCHAQAAKAYVDYAKAHDKGHILGLLLTTWYPPESLIDVLDGKGVAEKSESPFGHVRGIAEVYRAFTAQ